MSYDEFRRCRAGFEKWAEVNKSHFPAMAAQWDLKIDTATETTALLKRCKSVESSIYAGWDDACKALAQKIKDIAPPKSWIDSPRVMVDEGLRKSLAAAAKAVHSSKMLSEASALLCLLREDEVNNKQPAMPGRCP